jgi:hypothetical protein
VSKLCSPHRLTVVSTNTSTAWPVPLVLALEVAADVTRQLADASVSSPPALPSVTVSPSKNVVPMKCPEARGVRDGHDERSRESSLEHVVDRELAAR